MMLLRQLFDIRTFPVIERNFSPPYLQSEEHEAEYRKLGYTVLKNCIPEHVTTELLGTFEFIKGKPGKRTMEQFINTGSLADPEIKRMILEQAIPKVAKFLSTVTNAETCDAAIHGAYLIKPPGNNGALHPHQDSPVIDENKFHAAYVWIPLQDMTTKNGALQVLPGSHLWGNYPRPLVGYWPFHKHKDLLLERMTTLEVNKSDLIVYDSATIHASPPNNSDKTRLAFATTLLPKNASLVHHYYRGGKTLTKYRVDHQFYAAHADLSLPPGAGYVPEGEVPLPYGGSIGRRAVRNFLKQLP